MLCIQAMKRGGSKDTETSNAGTKAQMSRIIALLCCAWPE